MVETVMAMPPEVEQAAAPPPVVSPKSLREVILTHLQSLSAYHRGVLESGDVESVHKMRVTTRRLQAALDLLQTSPDDKPIRKLKKKLRNWRRRLSLVRNYDVFLMMMENNASMRRAANQEAHGLLKDEISKRRADIASRVRQRLEKINIDAMAAALGVNQEAGAENPEGKPDSLSNHLQDERQIVLRAADRLEQRLSEFQTKAAEANPHMDPVELHRLRIGAKRLRYLFEILAEMGYGDATRALNWLRGFQDKLGDWHDLVAQEEELIRIVTRPKFVKEHLKPSGRLLHAAAQIRKKRHKMASEFFPIKVPKSLASTTRRFTRALKRRAKSKEVSY